MKRSESEILIYTGKDGVARIDVVMEDESVWLSQDQLSDLFQKAKSTINEHIRNIYAEGELDELSTMRKFGISEFSTKPTNFYNLDVIISVGYRVKSHVGTHFRRWATRRLREYIIKGFVLDDERLKDARSGYFDELLDRIRDIRSSEKVFYRKVCDIFAMSIDYDRNTEMSQEFFATVQNKFHFAIHGHTAAEFVKLKADADKPNMGLTNFPGDRIKKEDVSIAKNYLNENELKQLNLIVNQYLEFAELQAMNRKPMRMADWVEKLHGFLTLNDREILRNAGKVSHSDAEMHALKEYEVFRQNEAKRIAESEDELDRAIKKLGPKK